MKYLIFCIAALGVLPLGYILTLNRKYMRYAVYAVILPVMMFNQVSINFFSCETYRGTSRGMEVSLIYLIAVAILIAMLINVALDGWTVTWQDGMIDIAPEYLYEHGVTV